MNDRVEQLEAQLAATTDTRTETDLLNALARELRDRDPERGLALDQRAYELAKTGQLDGRLRTDIWMRRLREQLRRTML